MLNLRVSVASSETPLSISLPPTATTSDLRAAIFKASAESLNPEKHRLRLISAGKLLPPSALLSTSGVVDGAFIHCAVSDLADVASRSSAPKREAGATAAPAPILVTEDATGETRILLPAATQTVATLRAAGLSDEQIIAVRFPFLLEDGDEGGDSEGDALRIDLAELEANERLAFVAAEDTRQETSPFPDPEEGPWNDFLWGFLLGALLGLIMLILSMDRSIALSRRWKRGIGLGAVVNIVFGIVMLANDGGGPR